MKTLPKILLNAVLIIGVLGFAAFASASSLPLGGQTYYLAGAGVTSTQTTVQLTYLLTPDGQPITMSEIGTIGYGVLEPQTTSKIEDVSFTGITQNTNGTATLTGVTRGVSFNYPYASSLTLQKSHAGGAQFIISNTAEFYYNEFSMQNNSNVFTWPTASSSPATKGYTDFVGSGGANIIPATFIAQGVSQLATGLQAASSTIAGSTGFNLVIPSSIATSTYNSQTAPLKVVVTNNQGTIDPNFINLANYTGSVQLSSTTVIGSTAALAIGKNEFATTTPGTGSWIVPSGITKVFVRIVGGGGSGGSGTSCGSGGGSGGYSESMLSVSGTLSFTIGAGGAPATSASGNVGGSSTVGALTAGGGAGGATAASTNNPIAGGGGGSASGGIYNSSGAQGQFCLAAASGTLNGQTSPSLLGSSGLGGTGVNGSASGAGNPGAIIINY